MGKCNCIPPLSRSQILLHFSGSQGFANQITTVDEAKQFYPLFGLGANVALIFSGRAVRWFSEIRASAKTYTILALAVPLEYGSVVQ